MGPLRWGWRTRATSESWEGKTLEPGGDHVGWYVPRDGGSENLVVISTEGMRVAWRAAMPDTPYRKGTVIEAMAPLVVAGTKAGERVSTTILPGNQRGYALPLSALAFKGEGEDGATPSPKRATASPSDEAYGEDEERFNFSGAAAATDAPDDWEDEPF